MKSIKKILSILLAIIIITSSVVSVDAAVVDFSLPVSTNIESATDITTLSAVDNRINIFERMNSAFNGIDFSSIFNGIDISFDFADSFKSLSNLSASLKIATNNMRLLGSNFLSLSAQVLDEITNAGTSTIEYGVSSTYTVTIPAYILATKPGTDLNKYSVVAEDVIIPVHTELGVSVLRTGKLVHHDSEDISIDYNMYKENTDSDDSLVSTGKYRLFKVPAGYVEGASANVYATLAGEVLYAGVYEEATVTFSLKVTDTSYTSEEIEGKALMYKIGKTVPENVLAEFNEDYTTVTVFSNGDSSDGLMMDWTEASSANPFYAHKDTLNTIIFNGSTNELKSIGDYAFADCTNITGALDIPSSVELVNTAAFKGCTGLTSVIFNGEDITESGIKKAKYRATGLSLSPAKPTVYNDANTCIGDSAFMGCTNVETISFGNTVKSIGYKSFEGCSSLTGLNTGASCDTIGNRAFYGCSSLSGDIVMPAVTTIEGNAFTATPDELTVIMQAPEITKVQSLPSQNNLILGTTVNTLGNSCFVSCDFDSVTFENDDGLVRIGDSAFARGDYTTPVNETTNFVNFSCERLEYVGANAFINCGLLSNNSITFTEKLESIGENAFRKTGIKKVEFEDGCAANIGFDAFYASGVKSIEFNKSSVTVEREAFRTDSLESVIIPNTLAEINYCSFAGKNLTSCEFKAVDDSGNVPEFNDTYSGMSLACVYMQTDKTAAIKYEYQPTEQVTATWYSGSACTITYDSEEVNQYATCSAGTNSLIFTDKVKRIGADSFKYANISTLAFGSNLEYIGANAFGNAEQNSARGSEMCDITIPDSCTYIGDGAFACNYYYTEDRLYNKIYNETPSMYRSVELGDGIEYIGEKAFYNMPNATGVIAIPDVCTFIGSYAFAKNPKLTGNIDIPVGVGAVNEGTFMGDASLQSVKFNNGLTAIGDSAFKGCVGLSGNIVIPDSVKHGIGVSAFEDCVKITTVTLGDGVDSVSNSAFNGCTALGGVNFGAAIANIGEYAFNNCSSLSTEIIIGDKIKNIGRFAFNGCGSIAKLSIGSSDCEIGGNAFTNCSGIVDLSLGLETIDATLTAKLGCSSYANPWSLTLFDSVKTIENNALKGNTSLSTIDFGNSVETIGNNSFSGCSSLTTLEFSNTLKSIGEYAFYDCHAVGGILTIPDACENIGKWAFASEDGTLGSVHYMNTPRSASITGLVMSRNIKTIGEFAFYGCYLITGDVTFPETLESIGDYAFSGAYGRYGVWSRETNGDYITQSPAFTGIYFEDCDATIGVKAFYNCRDAETIDLGDGTKSWGANCFGKCVNLVTLNVGNGILEISDNMFSGCSKLKNLDLGNTVEKIGNGAFSGTAIEGILTIPNTCTNIGDNAFINLTGITVLNMSNSIQTIGNSAFDGCTSIANTLILPDTLVSIGDRAFAKCSDMNGLTAPYTAYTTGSYAFMDCSDITHVTIPDEATTIATGLFSGCTGLVGTIIIHNAIETIGNEAFNNCTGIEKIVIGTAVTRIGDSAFNNNTGIVNGVSIPNSCTEIGDYAFSDCNQMPYINFGTGVNNIGSYAFYRCLALTTLNIPESVTSIGDYAFGTKVTSLDTIAYKPYNGTTWVAEEDQMQVASITMSPNLKTLGDGAFRGCAKLENVALPNSITTIGSNVFAYCYGLKSYTLPDIFFEESSYGFLECTGIQYAVINNTATSIAEGIFKGCTGIDSTVNIPGSVVTISDSAFGGCVNMSAVVFNEGLTTIQASAFLNCQSLRSLSFPDSLISIGKSAFGGEYHGSLWNGFEKFENMYLTSVTFGNSLKSIGDYAFFPNVSWHCTLDFPETLETIGERAFTRWYSLGGALHPELQYYIYETDEDGNTKYDDDGRPILIENCIYGINFTGNNLKTVGAYAFYNADQCVSAINLGSGISELGEGAFSNCPYVSAVSIPSPLITTIPKKAFYNCGSMVSLVLPENVEVIDESAFAGCLKLDGRLTIPESTTAIKKEAFYGCSSLDELVIGSNVNEIGDRAFFGFQGAVISMPEEINSLGVDVFGEAAQDDDGAVYIGAYLVSFDNIKNLTSYTVKPHTVAINTDAFKDEDLEEVILPDTVKTIGDNAFRNMTKLKSIALSTSLYKIGAYAFAGDTELITAALPASLEEIGNYAFSGCNKLSTINISSNVKAIGDYAFSGCAIATGTVNIAEGCTVSQNAFNGCAGITDVNITANDPTIGAYAFNNCTGIKNITMSGKGPGDTVTDCMHIDNNSDGTCDTCGKSTSELSVNKDYVIETPEYEGDNWEVDWSYEFPFVYTYTPGISGTYMIKFPVNSNKSTTFNVTDADGNKISLNSFANSASVKSYDSEIYGTVHGSYMYSATLTAGVTYTFATSLPYDYHVEFRFEFVTPEATSINTSAFIGVTGVESLTLGLENITTNTKTIFNYGKYSSPWTLTLLNTVKQLSDNSFMDTKVTGTIDIPSSCMSIGERAFKNCSYLTAIDASKSKISTLQFESLMSSGLTTLILPNSCKKIDISALVKCVSLNNIDMSSVSSISEYAFLGCGLTSLVTPESTKSIGDYAFYKCTVLTDVTINGENPKIGLESFVGCASLANVTINSAVTTGFGIFEDCNSILNVYTNSMETWCNCIFAFTDKNRYYAKSNPMWKAQNFYVNGVLTKDIVVPVSITTLHENAFCHMVFDSITIPSTVSLMENRSLYRIDTETAVLPFIGNTKEAVGYSADIFGISTASNWALPTSLKHLTVLGGSLGSSSFYHQYGSVARGNYLDTLILGENVENVYSSAIYKADPDNLIITGKETNIAAEALKSSGFIKELEIPLHNKCLGYYFGTTTQSKGIKQGDYYYSIPSSLTTVSVTDGTVCDNAFENCTDITAVNIAEGSTSIGTKAFYNTGIVSIDIPDTIEVIGDNAFQTTPLTHLTLPSQLKSIGNEAFCYCPINNEITLGNKLESIGASAFYNTRITGTITIPDSCSNIGDSAFNECTGITSLSLVGESKVIGSNAFAKTGLTGTLTIPNGTTLNNGCFNNITTLSEIVIGENVDLECGYADYRYSNYSYAHGIPFYGTTAETVTINSSFDMEWFARWRYIDSSDISKGLEPETSDYPATNTMFGFEASVKTLNIGENVNISFYRGGKIPTSEKDAYGNSTYSANRLNDNWNNLQTINLSSDNPYFTEKSGVIYNKNETLFKWIPKNINTDVVIGSDITVIPGNVFRGSSIKSIVFPNGLLNIESYAFSNCQKLTGNIIIPDGVTAIEEGTFYGCSNIDGNIVLPNTVKAIGYNAFSGCSKATGLTLGNQIESIGYAAFNNCESIESNISIPATCVSLGASAFNGCSSISGIDLRANITTIQSNTFNGCSSAEGTLSIPNTVTEIEENAFYGCSGMTELNLGNVITVGDKAFSLWSSLDGILTIPNSVVSIGEEAFCVGEDGSSLDKLIIGSGLETIGSRALTGHTELNEIQCDADNKFYKADGTLLYTINGKTIILASTGVNAEYVVPESVATIGEYAFAYNTKITSLTIPATVKMVMSGGFTSMPNLTTLSFAENGVEWIDEYGFAYNEGITSEIQLPDSLLYIGAYAFAGCSNVTWMGIGAGTEVIGEGAFDAVPNVTVDTENEYITIVNGEITGGNENFKPQFIGGDSLVSVRYSLSEDGKTLTISGSGPMMNWDAAKDITGIETDNLSPFAEMLDTIETIIIEDGVTSIGGAAFTNTNAFLNKVVWNPTLGVNDFATSPLKRLVIGKDVESIGDMALLGSNELTSIEIDEANPYLTIGSDSNLYTSDMRSLLFANKTSTGTYNGPETLETVAVGAFSSTGYSEINLPASVTVLPSYAFAFCRNLYTVNLPGAKVFGKILFTGHTMLNNLTLPVDIPLISTEYAEQYQDAFGLLTSTTMLHIAGEGAAPHYSVAEAYSGGSDLYPAYTGILNAIKVSRIVVENGVTELSDLMFATIMDEPSSTKNVLTSVSFGEDLERIGEAAFAGRIKLASFSGVYSNPNFTEKDGILYNADKSKMIALTTEVESNLFVPNTVTEIPALFAWYDTHITGITLSPNVTAIGFSAFEASSLNRIEIQNDATEFKTDALRGTTLDLYAREDTTSHIYAQLLNDNGDAQINFHALCSHKNKHTVEAVEATCTTVGYTEGVLCDDCGCWISGHNKIVLNHIDENGDGICERCGKSANDFDLNIPKTIDFSTIEIDEANPLSAYLAYKVVPSQTGTYTITDNTFDEQTMVMAIILRIDDINDFDVSMAEQLLVAQLLAAPDTKTAISEQEQCTVTLQQGVTYWFLIGVDSEDNNISKELVLHYLSCNHESVTTLVDGTPPVSCTQTGVYPVIRCNVCNELIRNGETWYMPHADTNHDSICDDCFEVLSEIPMNTPLSQTNWTAGETKYYKFIAPVTATYCVTSDYGFYKAFYDSSKTQEIPLCNGNSTSDSTIETVLTEGVTYYIAVRANNDKTSDVVLSVKDCPHTHIRVDTAPVAPVDCSHPGTAGVVWCYDCGTQIYNNEATYLPHTDSNNDGVCDDCGASTSDIMPGQTKTIDIVGGSITYLKFIPTITGSYTFASIGSSDTYGYLYDENKVEITKNDDSQGSNFAVTHDLIAGTVYYFGARYYDKSDSGSFEVTLTAN